METNFESLSQNELMNINGGSAIAAGSVSGMAAGALTVGGGVGAIGAGTGAAVAIGGGTSVLTMGAGALVACGPVGWAVLGIAGIGAFAGGVAIGAGAIIGGSTEV